MIGIGPRTAPPNGGDPGVRDKRVGSRKIAVREQFLRKATIPPSETCRGRYACQSREMDKVSLDFRPHRGSERLGGAEIDRAVRSMSSRSSFRPMKRSKSAFPSERFATRFSTSPFPIPIVAPSDQAEDGQ